MKVFNHYAKFYDALYHNKDYQKECDYLQKIFKKYSSKKIKAVLDLGCGTANHDLILARRSFKITGVDFSQNMLRIARKKAQAGKLKIDFYKGDIRKINLKKKFDAVISMFNVMGYQKNNEDFEQALLTANKHLKKDGLFVFDIWFGPAVLADKPKNKVKKVEMKNGYIIRKTESRFNLLKQSLGIFFQTKYYSVAGKLLQQNKELHQMRFFFPQEIKYFLEKTKFELIGIHPFLKMTGKPSEKEWDITVIAGKI